MARTASPRRRLRARTKLVLLLGGTVIALLILEGAARALAYFQDE